jgi:NAD(P)-dependent dehydrogenase (short-subunit alcohol dehydrogenase family)
MTRDLEGKSALVTGGASGIGRATALAFAREGARVAVADILEEAAHRTVSELEAMGGKALAIACDVTDDFAVKPIIARAVDAFGSLDCAFNNAGIAPYQVNAGGQKIADVAPEAWRRLINVNLTGVWLCLRHEVGQMRA